ncbi:MAG: substrate-binding domain-containing protein, partial [Planctomycetota bacterium]
EYLDESPNAWRRHERVLTERTERWLNRHKPTAVLSGHYLASEVLGNALGKMNMRCPADLSVVTFDQHPYNERWLHARPTTVALPLEAMGRWMAESARGVAEGAAPPPLTVLPCELTEGETVRPV